jgi:hypothetical protein
MGTIYCLASGEWGTNYEFYYSTALRAVVALVHGAGEDHWTEDRDVYRLVLNAREYEMLLNGTITLDEITNYDQRWEAITFEGNELSLCDFNP